MVLRLFVLAIACFSASVSFARERVALIIGNSQYEAVQTLRNPVNDATDLAAAFRRLGFSVTLHTDLDGGEMKIALRDFARSADGAEMAVLYFGGHGLEIDNENYLLPIDAQIERAQDAVYEANHLSQLLGAVSGATTLKLVLLDACRNNPFLNQMADASTRSLGRGLARVEPPGGVLVSYAAKGGTVAYDGEGRNSPYANALLGNLERPGLEIGKLFRRVRDEVYSKTSGEQEPFTYGSLPARDIYLAAARPQDVTETEILQAFARADIANSETEWLDFLDIYSGLGSNNPVIRRARQKLAALRQSDTTTKPLPVDSPLILACDQFASDPEDPARPKGVAGVAFEKMNAGAASQACALAHAGHPEHVRSRYQLGRALLSKGDVEDSEGHLMSATKSGYLAANVLLARLYLDEPAYAEKRNEAGRLLKDASVAGSSVAPRILAEEIMSEGNWMGMGFQEALDWYVIAATRGDEISMHRAGSRLLASAIDPEKQNQGAQFLEILAEKGDLRAINKLATHYLTERDAKNYARARELLERAIAADDKKALSMLIGAHRSGAFWPRNEAEAARWLLYGAESGDTSMMLEYGYVLETGRGVEKNPDRSAEFYVEAISRGNSMLMQRDAGDWDRDTARAFQAQLQTVPEARFNGPNDGVVGAGTQSAMRRLCKCRVPSGKVQFRHKFP